MSTGVKFPRAVTLWFIPWGLFYLNMFVVSPGCSQGDDLMCSLGPILSILAIVLIPCMCVVVFPKFGFCKKYKDIKNPTGDLEAPKETQA
jgi:hypothetical protein